MITRARHGREKFVSRVTLDAVSWGVPLGHVSADKWCIFHAPLGTGIDGKQYSRACAAQEHRSGKQSTFIFRSLTMHVAVSSLGYSGSPMLCCRYTGLRRCPPLKLPHSTHCDEAPHSKHLSYMDHSNATNRRSATTPRVGTVLEKTDNPRHVLHKPLPTRGSAFIDVTVPKHPFALLGFYRLVDKALAAVCV